MIIEIHYSDTNDGYMYDIYENEEALTNGQDSLDGGICTGSSKQAIEMAGDMATKLLETRPDWHFF